MGPSELLKLVVQELDRLELHYFVTGSMATIAYGEPRFTNDIDIVIQLPISNTDQFCASFPPPDFYCSPAAAREAVLKQRQFNIIHPASGLKIDVMIPADTEFNQSRMDRRVHIRGSDEFAAWFASPEDVILKKLLYYQEGGSEKHVRDILGVLKVRGSQIDLAYLSHWAQKLGVISEWSSIQELQTKVAP
ncbi:hypothetical protein [Planctomicrobium piriforme]|uniref:Nucleotidyl transferase AbiEii toxin, Type IV TA system n=1 Tax=Planctomicrobium piriforme TaxID=1576369 RepID=A0A1I3FXH2_9PLAN|nr:hypothetical protein [Planctomicrobium piriforme]SFI15885.1 hypothetical protein SAMN05421753_10676 [Planctomicrobium piriforme]